MKTHLDLMLGIVVGGATRRIQIKAQLFQDADRVEQTILVLVAAYGQQNVLLGQSKPGADQRLQIGLIRVLAEAGHLARAHHLDAEQHVGARQPTKRELWHFDTDPPNAHDAVDHGRTQAHGHLSGHRDEVVVQRFAHKRKRAGHTQIALDHFELVVLGDQLQIERAVDLESGRDRARYKLDLGLGLRVEYGRRDESGVATVHARILHVTRYGHAQDLAVFGHRVDVYFFGVEYELRYDHRVLFGHRAGGDEISLEVLIVVGHFHGRARQHVRGPHQTRVAHFFAEVDGALQVLELFPFGLQDADVVE